MTKSTALRIIDENPNTLMMYKEIDEYINIEDSLEQLGNSGIDTDSLPLIIKTIIEYMYTYKVYDPVGRDAIISATVFMWESMDMDQDAEIRMKFADRWRMIMDKCGILDYKRMLLDLSKHFKKQSNKAKRVKAKVEK